MVGVTEKCLRDYERALSAWSRKQLERVSFASITHQPRPDEFGLTQPYQLWAAEQITRKVMAEKK